MAEESNVAHLAAHKCGHSKMWTPEDALRDALRRVDGKEGIRLAVHWLAPTDDGGVQHHYAVSNLSYAEHIALLEAVKTEAIRDWIEGR